MSLRVTRQVLESFGRSPIAVNQTASLPNNPAQLLDANWVNDIILDTDWLTKISASKNTLSEERRSLQEKPVRTLKAGYLSRNWAESTKILSSFARYSQGVHAVPIYPDSAIITANNATTVFVLCDTRFRRFFVGQLIATISPQGDVEYAKIETMGDQFLQLDQAVTAIKGGLVLPLMFCEASLKHSTRVLTDRVISVNGTFDEVNSRDTLPPSWEGEIEALFPYHYGVPLLTTPPNWNDTISLEIRRDGSKYGQGKGSITSLSGARPRFGFKLPFCFDSREEFWHHLNFFDSRRGRAKPFMVRSQHSLWQVQSATTTGIVVDPSAPIADFSEFYDYAYLEFSDGTYAVRQLDTFTDNGGSYTLGFDSPITSQEASMVQNATPAMVVRFEKDSMRERWETNDTVVVDLEVTELLEEKSVGVTVL